jgi:hypothetical protein
MLRLKDPKIDHALTKVKHKNFNQSRIRSQIGNAHLVVEGANLKETNMEVNYLLISFSLSLVFTVSTYFLE